MPRDGTGEDCTIEVVVWPCAAERSMTSGGDSPIRRPSSARLSRASACSSASRRRFVYLLTDVRLAGAPLGLALALVNAVLLALYIVLADRVAKRPGLSGIDGLAAALLVAAIVITPLGVVQAAPALLDPVALLAGIGVGISSSVIPYVSDQLAMARLARATYALMVALLPAVATVVGSVVLTQIPAWAEVAGVALVVAGVAAPQPGEARGARASGAVVAAQDDTTALASAS